MTNPQLHRPQIRLGTVRRFFLGCSVSGLLIAQFPVPALAAVLPQKTRAAAIIRGDFSPPRLLDEKRPQAVRQFRDDGESYRGADGTIYPLWRVPDEAALLLTEAVDPQQTLATAEASFPLARMTGLETLTREANRKLTVLQSTDPTREPDREALSRLPGVTSVRPVYIDPASRTRMIATAEVILRLKPGVSIEELQPDLRAAGLEIVRRVGNARLNSYLVRTVNPATDVLAVANELATHPKLEWATPNFVRELVRNLLPNDPLFPFQQHLHNTGQQGGVSDADVDAPEAWDRTTGRADIVIAIVDDGVDTTHPDLSIFTNPGESGGGRESNGVDDDDNGFIDDVRGWDFAHDDNNPRPATQTHGTACAGVAAAMINNGTYAAGIAGGCRVLPVKIFTDAGGAATDADIGAAISYAAEFADVISNSWGGGSPSAFIDNAITDAVTNGRNGRGCPVFFATGNLATAWLTVAYSVGQDLGAGTYLFGFRYTKDGSATAGEDLIMIDNVVLVDGDRYTHLPSALGPAGRQDFEGPFPPPGWTQHPEHHADWSVATTHPYVGTGGSRSARSGTIGHLEFSELRTPPVTIDTNDVLVLRAYLSTEADFDGLSLHVYRADGSVVGSYGMLSGVFEPRAGLAYPASHASAIAVGASTDSDRRADYSQFGSGLDFLAPSSGGWNPITTLDLAGPLGNSLGDYVNSFTGTSASTPLAAGVAALILSVNTNLTAQEVREIMRASADKIGPGPYSDGFNSEYGYGRLNARAALDEASPPVTVTATDNAAAEPSNPGVFTFTRSGSVLPQITVRITVSGTATRGVDYNAFPTNIIFAAGALSTNITVAPIDDALLEGTETVVVTINPGAGYTVGTPSSATINLSDNELPAVTVTAADPTAAEPADTGNFVFSRSGATNDTLTVNFTLGGTAASGTDYLSLGSSITFLPGVATTNRLVTPVNDTLIEPTETVILTIVPGTGYTVGSPSSATISIIDDDTPRVSVTATDDTASEPGVNTATLLFSRTGSTAAALQVNLGVSGTAITGTDFIALPPSITFPAGITEVSLQILPINDSLPEGTETIVVSIASGPGYELGNPSSVTVSLHDDDLPPVPPGGVLRLDGINDFATRTESLWPNSGTLASYTIEAWIYPRSLEGMRFIAADDAYDFDLSPSAVSHALYGPLADFAEVLSAQPPRLNEWNHVAVTFDHVTRQMRLALNGQISAPVTFPNTSFYSDPIQNFTLGARRFNPKSPGEGFFHGDIDEVRLSDVVRYTSNFTPATRFSTDANTRALYHFDEATGSTTFADSSGNARNLTGIGGAHVASMLGPEGVPQGPVAHWRFDETSGFTAADSSGHGNEGTLINGPAWLAQGQVRRALSFDGVNDYLTVPNAPELEVGRNDGDFTVALWVNLQEGPTGQWRTLMQKGETGATRTFSLFLWPDSNRIHYRVSTTTNPNAGRDSIAPLPVGTWTHVALVKIGNRLRLYLNGSLDSEQILPAPVVHNAGPIYMADTPWTAATRTYLDDVRLYRRALSESEIMDLAVLVGHWPMAEGFGGISRDLSAYGNHLVLAGGSQTPAWLDRASDHALSFDGTDDFATIANAPELELGRNNADFSVAFWVNLQQGANGQWRTLLQKGQNGATRTFSFFLRPDSNRVHWRVSTVSEANEGGDSAAALPVGTWTHLAMVKSGNTIRFYFNGALDSQRILPSAVVHNTGPIYLGDVPWTAATRTYLDELRLYRRALTELEIVNLAGLVGHWRFAEGSGSVARDSSAFGNSVALGAGAQSPAWIAQGANTALSFDGLDDVATIANAPELELGRNNADFTVAFWVNLLQDANGQWRALLQKGQNGATRTFTFFLHPDSNRVHWRVSTVTQPNEGGSSVAALPVGTWSHLAMVKSGNTLRFYLNGSLDSQRILPSAVVHNTGPIYIGDTPWGAPTKMYFDDLRLYNRALSVGALGSLASTPIGLLDSEPELTPEFQPSDSPEAGAPEFTRMLRLQDDSSDSSAEIKVSADTMVLRWQLSPGQNPADWTFEISHDLHEWTPVGNSGEWTVEETPDGPVVRIELPADATGRQFIRARHTPGR